MFLLHTQAVDQACNVHCRVFEHIRTINSGGDYHMAYSEDPSQVYNPKWVFIPPRMCAAVLIPPWISVTIHRPGWCSPITCTALVGWLLEGNVAMRGRCWRNKYRLNVLKPYYCHTILSCLMHSHKYSLHDEIMKCKRYRKVRKRFAGTSKHKIWSYKGKPYLR